MTARQSLGVSGVGNAAMSLLAHKIPLLPATPLDSDYAATLHALECIANGLVCIEVGADLLSAHPFLMLIQQCKDTLAHAPTSLYYRITIVGRYIISGWGWGRSWGRGRWGLSSVSLCPVALYGCLDQLF